jgi:hypothetical protein
MKLTEPDLRAETYEVEGILTRSTCEVVKPFFFNSWSTYDCAFVPNWKAIFLPRRDDRRIAHNAEINIAGLKRLKDSGSTEKVGVLHREGKVRLPGHLERGLELLHLIRDPERGTCGDMDRR